MATDAMTGSNSAISAGPDKLRPFDELLPSLTLGEKLDLIDRVTRSLRSSETPPPQPPETEEQIVRRQRQAVFNVIEDVSRMRADAEPILMDDRDQDRIIYGL